jgi:putative salt-induced outer membrane protein YdiY
MLEQERLALPDTAVHAVQTTVLRSSSFLTFRLTPGERLVVTSTMYAQPQLDDVRDIRILENLRLASPITEQIALTISFDLRYDSRPPDGIARLDTTLRTGVTYTY